MIVFPNDKENTSKVKFIFVILNILRIKFLMQFILKRNKSYYRTPWRLNHKLMTYKIICILHIVLICSILKIYAVKSSLKYNDAKCSTEL